METTSIPKFLGTFNAPETAPVTTPAVPAPPAQAAAPEATSVPVVALPAVMSLADELAKARAIQAQVAAAEAAKVVAPPPAPPEDEELKASVKRLERKLDDERRARVAAEEHALLVQAVAQANAGGLDPAFNVYITGKTVAELQASINVAFQEQKSAQDRWQAAQAAQAANAPKVEEKPATPQFTTPTAPVGVVTTVAPPAAQLIGVPSTIEASTAQQQPEGLTEEQRAYLRSPEAKRNGLYAQYRHLLMESIGAVSGASRMPGFNPVNHPNPNVQQGRQLAPTASYGGVQIPQFQRTNMMGPPAAYAGAPGQQNFGGNPPQPATIEAGVPMDAGAAIAAAKTAIDRARSRTRPGVSHHG